MWKRIVAVTSITILSMLVEARAQSPAVPNASTVAALESRVKQFLDRVALGEVVEAYTDFLPEFQESRQSEAMRSLVTRTQELETRYGRFRGSERIAAREYGRDLIRMEFVYKCDDFPVIWSVWFYRTPVLTNGTSDDAPWRVVEVRFDTDLQAMSERLGSVPRASP